VYHTKGPVGQQYVANLKNRVAVNKTEINPPPPAWQEEVGEGELESDNFSHEQQPTHIDSLSLVVCQCDRPILLLRSNLLLTIASGSS